MKFIAIAAIVGVVGAGGAYVGGDKIQCLVGRVTGNGCQNNGGCAHGGGAGCHHGASAAGGGGSGACGTASNAAADVAAVAAIAPARATSGLVDPWAPVEEAFSGCDKSCGSRAEGPEAGVTAQHGDAKVGERVFCPVSGVVITVAESSAHRDVGGHRYYFCCESCAAYFSANVAKVMQARGMLTAT